MGTARLVIGQIALTLTDGLLFPRATGQHPWLGTSFLTSETCLTACLCLSFSIKG